VAKDTVYTENLLRKKALSGYATVWDSGDRTWQGITFWRRCLSRQQL